MLSTTLGQLAPQKKKKTLISIFSKINNDHKVDVEMIIVI
jgi:hypothetical protein